MFQNCKINLFYRKEHLPANKGLNANQYLCEKFNVKIPVTKQATLLAFLFEQYADSPKTRIKKLLQSGSVIVNGRSVTLHSFSLRPGDTVEISRAAGNVKTGAPFHVLYDDNEVIVVDKPAGIATSSVDGSRNVRDEISEFLRDRSKGKVRAWVVHRLDKEVSGVLLFAKSEELADKIRESWDEASKRYYALVEGKPGKDEGTVKSWLREDSKQKVHTVRESPGAKYAITDYKFIKQYGEYSLLDITTRTGRKNQIRVHMADLGCPIAGDRKYGASAEFERRVRLHAYSLAFPHPASGKPVTVQSKMPAGFLTIQEEDEKYK